MTQSTPSTEGFRLSHAVGEIGSGQNHQQQFRGEISNPVSRTAVFSSSFQFCWVRLLCLWLLASVRSRCVNVSSPLCYSPCTNLSVVMYGGSWASSVCNVDACYEGLLQPWRCTFTSRSVFAQLPGHRCTVGQSGCVSARSQPEALTEHRGHIAFTRLQCSTLVYFVYSNCVELVYVSFSCSRP